MDCINGHLCPTVVQETKTSTSNQLAAKSKFKKINADQAKLVREVIESGFATLKYERFFQSPQLAKLAAGPFIRMFLEKIGLLKEEKTSSANMLHLYVGHDNGPVGPLLGAIGARLPPVKRWPNFGAMLILSSSRNSSTLHLNFLA